MCAVSLAFAHGVCFRDKPPSVIRALVAQRMGVDAAAMDAQREHVNALMVQCVNEMNAAPAPAPAPKKRRVIADSDDEEDAGQVHDAAESDGVDGASSADDDEHGDSDKEQRRPTSTPKRASKAASKTKKTKSSSPASADGDDAQVAKLKQYVRLCGIRKQWSKELADLSVSQQVRHIQRVLADAGIEGAHARP